MRLQCDLVGKIITVYYAIFSVAEMSCNDNSIYKGC